MNKYKNVKLWKHLYSQVYTDDWFYMNLLNYLHALYL